jgi:hypothetical protein
VNDPTDTNEAAQQESDAPPSSTNCHPQDSNIPQKQNEPSKQAPPSILGRPKHPFTLEEILAAKRERRRRPKQAPKPCKQNTSPN